MNKNIFLLRLTLIFSLFSFLAYSQQTGRLYMSTAALANVYDITTGNTPTIAATFVNTGSRMTNLAVGYDPNITPSPLMFIHSATATGGAVYKNGAPVSGVALPTGIGGFGTNNVTGPQFGHVYGFATGTKTLSRVYPTATATPITITGDAIWNSASTTIFTNDAFYDYDNNLYAVVANGANKYLYKIKINLNSGVPSGTAVATQVFQVTGTLPASVLGTAYLNGKMYLVDAGSGNNATNIYSINMGTGVAKLEKTLVGDFTGSRDLASVDYFVPFTFDCEKTTILGNGFFPHGATATRTVRVAISDIYVPTAGKNYTINISGDNFAPVSRTQLITPTTTYIDVPVTYNGGGSTGYRNLTVDLEGSTTKCTFSVLVDNDSDGDDVPDMIDIDDDNDGILDTVECPYENVVDTNFSSTNGQVITFDAPAADKGFVFDIYTLDNSFSLVVNGTNLTTKEIQFHAGDAALPQNIKFSDGTLYGIGISPIWEIVGTSANPAIRVVISEFGVVTLWGSKSSGGSLFPLTLFDGNTINKIIWNPTANNAVKVSQFVIGDTNIAGSGKGLKKAFCDSDGDGIPDELDLDSDNDGCPDAYEGGATINMAQLVTAGGILRGGNGTNPLITPTGGTYNKSVLQNLCAGASCVNAQGLPQLSPVPAGYSNTTGQTIGDSQNDAVSNCACYNDPNLTGTPEPTKHGISLLQRAGRISAADWPLNRNGGFTVLESNTK